MAVELDSPGSAEDLYLDRGAPVEPWRPIMTGDVFAGVQIPGCDEHELVMILAHPCSLRRGVKLVDRVQALPVVPHPDISLDAWKGHYRVLPLPELKGEGTDAYAARLSEFGMVASSELELDKRLSCLAELGIVLLQQRFFHNQSRVKVARDTLFRWPATRYSAIARRSSRRSSSGSSGTKRWPSHESRPAHPGWKFSTKKGSPSTNFSAPLTDREPISELRSTLPSFAGMCVGVF